jgi:predicted transposase YbfD/YdcC
MSGSERGPRLAQYLGEIEDPRVERNKRHKLLDIMVLTVCAVICGCETWQEIAEYGRLKRRWLKRFLELPNGVPSHDTIRRLFIRLEAEELQRCFLKWVEAVRQHTRGEVVSIDGKTLRRSLDAAKGKPAIHMVSAWAHANGMVLGQRKTDEKSNEITAIPELLKLLQLKGCVVTIDAIGCQAALAKQIVEKKADYVLAVKANQPNLHEQLKWFFDDIDLNTDLPDGLVDYHRTLEKDHGRIESRECLVSSELDWDKQLKEWPGLKSIAMVRATRSIAANTTVQCRYYLSSLEADAEQLCRVVRAHWGIENSLHWVLDMSFREDESRMRAGNSAQNFAVMRHIALNLVKRDTSSKASLKSRRKACGWNDQYLEALLFESPDTLQSPGPSM